jgi:hypothetical protein
MQYAVGYKACQSLPQKLNIVGIFHASLPEKSGTGGGVTS